MFGTLEKRMYLGAIITVWFSFLLVLAFRNLPNHDPASSVRSIPTQCPPGASYQRTLLHLDTGQVQTGAAFVNPFQPQLKENAPAPAPPPAPPPPPPKVTVVYQGFFESSANDKMAFILVDNKM